MKQTKVFTIFLWGSLVTQVQTLAVILFSPLMIMGQSHDLQNLGLKNT